MPINAVEPNEIEELLVLFEKIEPNKTHWIRLGILGWKDVDFVETGMAKTAGSARSYLKQCKNALEQFLTDNDITFGQQKDRKTPKTTIITLFLAGLRVIRGLFDF